jgi:hypothetical protein
MRPRPKYVVIQRSSKDDERKDFCVIKRPGQGEEPIALLQNSRLRAQFWCGKRGDYNVLKHIAQGQAVRARGRHHRAVRDFGQ